LVKLTKTIWHVLVAPVA